MSELPSKEDLRRNLSRRGMVAYAVRCAQRVQPLYRSLPAKDRAALDRVIDAAAAFVSGGGEAIVGICAPAVAIDGARAAPYAPSVVYAAGRAAAYAYAGADAAGRAAANAAYATARVYPATAAAAWRDYKTLRRLCRKSAGELGDPMELDQLGPLWPKGEPEWFRNPPALPDEPEDAEAEPAEQEEPEQPEPCGDYELVLELDVPAGVSEGELLDVAKRLSQHADRLHRAIGGKGLKVNRLEILESADVPEEVPSG